MPGSPAVSPHFSVPRYNDVDTASFSSQVNAITDTLDAALGVRDELIVVEGANYTANPGECVVATAAITVTLPSAPADQTRVTVLAQSGDVTVNAQGTDKITKYGSSNLGALAVKSHALARLRYHSGVWYFVEATQVAGGDASGLLESLVVNTWGGQTKAQVVEGSPPQAHAASHEPGGSDEILGITDAQVAGGNKDGLGATPSMRTLGTAALQACAGNDSRLSDARPPTAHHASHEPGGSDALTSLTDASFALANKDGAAGTPSLRTLGSGAQQAAAGNAIGDALQNGVVGSGDFALSGISVAANGSTVTLTIAAGVAWVLNTSGILVRVVRPASGGITLTPPSLPPSGSTQTYCLRMDTSGTFVLEPAGAAQAGDLPVAYPTFLPGAGYLGIANVSIYNNAGSYRLSTNAGGLFGQGTNWLDRRPWARGAYNSPGWSLSASNNNGWTKVSSGSIRLECTGAPMSYIGPSVQWRETSPPNIDVYWGLGIDGAVTQIGAGFIDTTSGQSEMITTQLSAEFTPSAGSHVFDIWQYVTGGTGFGIDAIAGGHEFEEKVRAGANNGTR